MDSIPQMEPNFDHEEAEAVYEYMKSGGWVTEFKKSREFEKSICDYTGAKYCHLINNGTISLSLALLAVGIKPGDKVLVPNLTMIATPNSVRLIGAKPVFSDVSQKSLTLDIEKLKKIIENDDIKAVIHVSLNTRPGDLLQIRDFCQSKSIPLIEDSAQSLGSFYKGRHVGTFGDIGSFSFSSPKIISTGQGGALITNDIEISNRIKRLKDFGRQDGGVDDHPFFGINCKFTDIQSVIGIEQMKKLESRVEHIKKIYLRYYFHLSKLPQIYMFPGGSSDSKLEGSGWIPWFIDIYLPNLEIRDSLKEYLFCQKIGSRKIYPAVNSQPIYNTGDKQYPVSQDWSSRGLWLPSSSKLTLKQVDIICDQIKLFFKTLV